MNVNRESLVGRGYALGVDVSGVHGSVLIIDCKILPLPKVTGGVRVVGITGRSVQDSAQIGFNLLKQYSPRFADLDIEIRADRLLVQNDSVPVSGVSAGQTFMLAMISALVRESFDKDVCATGSLAVNGRAGIVGGIQPQMSTAKLDIARMTGFKICLIPQIAMDNLTSNFPDYIEMNEDVGCRIIGCKDWFEYARYAFPNILNKSVLIRRLRSSMKPDPDR